MDYKKAMRWYRKHPRGIRLKKHAQTAFVRDRVSPEFPEAVRMILACAPDEPEPDEIDPDSPSSDTETSNEMYANIGLRG